jgi:tRNA (guanine37-N1)-methyltransferase
MGKGIRVRRERAEEVRQELVKKGILDTGLKVRREGDEVIFPVKGEVEGYETYEGPFEERERRGSLEENLAELVGRDRAAETKIAFDIIGDIAVVELAEEDMGIKREVGEALLRTHRALRTAVLKSGVVEGRMRLRGFEHLAGEERTETLYKEHGMTLKLDIGKVYFSPRLSFERKRLLELARDGETVVDLFCGIGPFAILLARYRDVKVYAVDLNPEAVEYLKENILINRVAKKVVPLLGDAREASPKGVADRVIMNLPKSADRFLDTALDALKEEGGTVHFYSIAPEEDLWSRGEALLEEAASQKGKEVKITGRRVVRPYSPRRYHVVFDAWIG